MADYFLNNNCQPEADINGYLKSLPSEQDSGHSYRKEFSAPYVVVYDTDLFTSIETSQNVQTLETCTIGTQAMAPSGISFDDKLEFTWLLIGVIVIAFSVRQIRRTF